MVILTQMCSVPDSPVFSLCSHTMKKWAYKLGRACGNQDYCRSVPVVGATQVWCTNKDDLSLCRQMSKWSLDKNPLSAIENPGGCNLEGAPLVGGRAPSGSSTSEEEYSRSLQSVREEALSGEGVSEGWASSSSDCGMGAFPRDPRGSGPLCALLARSPGCIEAG